MHNVLPTIAYNVGFFFWNLFHNLLIDESLLIDFSVTGYGHSATLSVRIFLSVQNCHRKSNFNLLGNKV